MTVDKLIVGFGGWGKSGKDALANIMVNQYRYTKTYMSKPLELALLALNPPIPLDLEDIIEAMGGSKLVLYADLHATVGYDESKREKWVRLLLQRLGTEVGREMFDEDVWVNKVFAEVQNGSEMLWTITGIRFDNELEALRSAGGIAVWVNRPGYGPVNTHKSDNTLGPDDFDLIVENNGSLVYLSAKADTLHDKILEDYHRRRLSMQTQIN